MIWIVFSRLSLFVSLAVVCLAGSFPEYPIRAVRDYSSAVAKSGLVVAAVALDNEDDRHTYFGMSLRSKGYLPVLVVVKNETSDVSYLLNKEKLTYAFKGRLGSISAGPATPSRTDKAAMIAGNIPSVFTLMARLAAAKETELRQHLIMTGLQSTTLSPGISAQGFIFVPLHGKHSSTNQIRVTIPFGLSGTKEVVAFDFTI